MKNSEVRFSKRGVLIDICLTMKYLALGDSISIDDYTGRAGGGAASQFSGLINASEFVNLTRDGLTTKGVLDTLESLSFKPDIITITAGGNDLLELSFKSSTLNQTDLADFRQQATNLILGNLQRVAKMLTETGATVVMNTIYDPTDGDDSAVVQLGIPARWREVYNCINSGIREIALRNKFTLCDLQLLFSGHGISSENTWIVLDIEPNLPGATAIAQRWHDLVSSRLC